MYDARRTAAQRGYGYRWQVARAKYLDAHPLCCMCAALGKTTIATVVDHIIPHRDNRQLFWDKSNWQSLCVTCHSKHKQSQEATGNIKGCGADGIPMSINHHWNK